MTENAHSFYTAAAQLSESVAGVLCKIDEGLAAEATEIRLRSGRSITLTIQNNSVKLNIFTDTTDMEECFMALCGYSYQHVEECVACGYVPMKNGHRAGICGTYHKTETGREYISDITSINIRVARVQLTQCPDALKTALYNEGGVLICGAPGSGKTTLLRAAAKYLSDIGKKVCIVDERFELAPDGSDECLLKCTDNCDVLSGYPKHIGMLHAVRTLSPDVIMCDEIGGTQDAQAVVEAANAGVKPVASIHGEGKSVLRRPQCKMLLCTGAFKYAVFIKPICEVSEVYVLC